MVAAKKVLFDSLQSKNSIDNRNIQYVVCDEDTFPHAKKLDIAGLYVLGNTSLLSQKSVGIVGTRQMTQYGKRIVDTVVRSIAGKNIITVSGGASGVDTAVHQASLLEYIPTIMVLAGGIERYLSSTKHALCTSIIKKGGLLVSEYDPLVEPKKYTFPQRNRIIAMLSTMIIIPEAGEKSGALITATYAKKIEKPVFGAPQDIFSNTGLGVNQYIKSGHIRLITTIEGMLHEIFPFDTFHTLENVNSLPVQNSQVDLVTRSLQELGLE